MHIHKQVSVLQLEFAEGEFALNRNKVNTHQSANHDLLWLLFSIHQSIIKQLFIHL